MQNHFKGVSLQLHSRRARLHVKAMPRLLRGVRIIRIKLDEFIVTDESHVICRRCQKVEVPSENKSKLDERGQVSAFMLGEQMARRSRQLPTVPIAFTHAVIQMKILAGTPNTPERYPEQALVKWFEIRGEEFAQPSQP